MDRKYPDIDFVETDAEGILSSMVMMFEEITGRTLYPASPEKLFISWCAAVIIQQRVLINETAKKNVPRKPIITDNIAVTIHRIGRGTAISFK